MYPTSRWKVSYAHALDESGLKWSAAPGVSCQTQALPSYQKTPQFGLTSASPQAPGVGRVERYVVISPAADLSNLRLRQRLRAACPYIAPVSMFPRTSIQKSLHHALHDCTYDHQLLSKRIIEKRTSITVLAVKCTARRWILLHLVICFVSIHLQGSEQNRRRGMTRGPKIHRPLSPAVERRQPFEGRMTGSQSLHIACIAV